jgi:REP element-mobilizing transposase RayT
MVLTQPVRRSIRLPGFDYSSANWYYVTICTKQHEQLFGDVVDGDPVDGDIVGAGRDPPAPTNKSPYISLNNCGKIVMNVWNSLPQHHSVTLDAFQIMPNHMHGIIVINHTGGSRPAPTLATIIGMFKSQCTKNIRQIPGNQNKVVWQRNYYEHIIRDAGELTHVRQYIRDNPKNWKNDKLFLYCRED